MTRLPATVLVFLYLVSLVGAAEVSPPSPIPEHHLIRVTLAEGERAWILRSDFQPVDLLWASAERIVVWTGPPGRYAILTWTDTGQGQQIVEIVRGSPPPPPPPDEHAPVAQNDTATTLQGQAVTIAVTANDTDADGDLDPTTVEIIQNPIGGTAATTGTGVVYSPREEFSGTDIFSYRVGDRAGNKSNAATVTVQVKEGVGPNPNILNEYGIGQVAYAEALRVGKPTETAAMAAAAQAALTALVEGRATSSMAEAMLRETRLKQSGNWGVWEQRVELVLKQAISQHGGGAVVYRDYMLEIATALGEAAKKQGNR